MSEEEKKEMIELITPQKTDKDYEEEIERLNNIIKTKDEGIKAFTEDLCETTEELEKAKNIIKEVREYIEPFYENALDYTEFKEILEILDKTDKGE